MRNLAVKQENSERISEIARSVNSVSDVIDFLARDKLIAQQAEEACHLEGNLNSPDFDVFEAKYRIASFA